VISFVVYILSRIRDECKGFLKKFSIQKPHKIKVFDASKEVFIF